MRHYSKITSSNGDFFQPLADAIDYFYREYEEAKTELRPKTGGRIADLSSNIPGMIEHRYGQLQELESILLYLQIQYDKVKGEKKRNFFEHYARQLSERLADQYADIEPDVVVLREFIQQVALVRNLFLGISKGLDSLHYQIGHIIQLRKAGIEDAVF
jgi:hypothetical protein